VKAVSLHYHVKLCCTHDRFRDLLTLQARHAPSLSTLVAQYLVAVTVPEFGVITSSGTEIPPRHAPDRIASVAGGC
jgi:hypothetical protein